METKTDEVLEQQRKSWDTFAPGWKKWDDFMMGFMVPVRDAMLDAAGLKDGMSVLDVAVGTGEPGLTAASRLRNGKVTGTDLSEVMVRIANENAKARKLPNYEARVAQGASLAFPESSFDAVICRFGVMFFPDPAAGVREMGRVLKKGGRLTLAVWAPADKNPWASLVRKVVADTMQLPKPSPDEPGMFRFGPPGSAQALLEGAGFTGVTVTPVEWTYTIASPQKHWELITEVAAPVAGPLSKADAATRASIHQKVLQEVGRFAKNGAVSMPAVALVVSGTR